MNRPNLPRPPLSLSSRTVLGASMALLVAGNLVIFGGTLPARSRQEPMPVQTTTPLPLVRGLPNTPVSVKFDNAPAREVLNAVFEGTGMTYRVAPGLESAFVQPTITLETKESPLGITVEQIIRGFPDRQIFGPFTYSVEGSVVTIDFERDSSGLPVHRTTLNFTNAPLRTVLDTLFPGKNYYLPATVSGNIRVNLKDAPFLVALHTVLQGANRPVAYHVRQNHVTIFETRPRSGSGNTVAGDIPTVPVSGNFVATPIRTVLEQIFEQADVSRSLSRDTYGTVTIRLNGTPLNVALRRILAQSNPPLKAYRQSDGTIHIEPIDARTN